MRVLWDDRLSISWLWWWLHESIHVLKLTELYAKNYIIQLYCILNLKNKEIISMTFYHMLHRLAFPTSVIFPLVYVSQKTEGLECIHGS